MPGSGLVIVDKPAGLTSHDVVGRLRRILDTRRIGHAGTLDPMATGVLVLGVGKGTKLLGYLALRDKSYTATIRLGESTDTGDAEGQTLSTMDVSTLDEVAIRVAMIELTGTIQQVPSAVSAIKVDGRRAYARVRAGETVQLSPRTVTVTAFALDAVRRTEVRTDLDVTVECSTGTYVRALARDLGAALGVGGHLTALRRTRVGPFTLETARTLDEIAEEQEPGLSLGLDEAVAATLPGRQVDAEAARALSHGQMLPPAGLPGVYGAFDPHGHVVALLTERDRQARPVVVFTPGC